MLTAIVHPGLYDSSFDHWQSRWICRHPRWHRVAQGEWEAPVLADWVAGLDAAIRQRDEAVLLVCHSAGCIAAAAWAASNNARHVIGALLVAPADSEASSFPVGPTGFAPMPMVPLPFPSIVVASDNDPYASLDRSRAFAHAWGSRLVVLPQAGHINADAGFGDWEEGLVLLRSLST